MATLKVKQLEWYMKDSVEEMIEDGYYKPLPDTFKLIGRDGYYCRGNDVWFEHNGIGFAAYPNCSRMKARESFCYDLKVNDEAILPKREVEALRTILKTNRDGSLKKAIRTRLYTHESAVSIRETGRRARISALSFLKRIKNHDES